MYQSPIKISIIISSSLVLLIEQNTLFLAPHRTVPATIFLGGMRLLKLELRDRYFATFIPGTPDCLSRTTQHHVVGLDNRLIWGHQKITFFKSLADSNKESNQQSNNLKQNPRAMGPTFSFPAPLHSFCWTWIKLKIKSTFPNKILDNCRISVFQNIWVLLLESLLPFGWPSHFFLISFPKFSLFPLSTSNTTIADGFGPLLTLPRC